ncbi:phosphate signaling complex protein PhoU [Marseilla massiliensis]|uniref:Phosphate-specific transport system accessory protein PhoU n=1 Tax=Marseilla massiliensis TaxID=1841864 RepID=A0A938WS21_9BACT|nr:phosphate signaling complex protein PhoU [Marseilla massiliensis]MBM6673098.1 phosphate signaling complex protein PhoU [Marseilla massiliensis]
MVKFVEDELKSIRQEILDMWTLVYDQMNNVCEAIPTVDKEKAWDVLIREKRVNAYELKLDCDIEDFLVLYNPVAVDMRFIVAMLKINTDLERIGDFAENIARFIIRQDGERIDAELLEKTRLKEMADAVLDMLATAKTALENEDLALANTLFEKDNLVDEINAASTKALADYIGQHPEKAAFCLDFKGVFLRLERTGDHITNLAEEIVFYIDAVVLKHSSDKNKTDQALLRRMQEGQE